MNAADLSSLLNGFSDRWKLDGDLVRCRSCKRVMHWIWSHSEGFAHASSCRNRDDRRPWVELVELLAAVAQLAPEIHRAAPGGDSATAERRAEQKEGPR